MKKYLLTTVFIFSLSALVAQVTMKKDDGGFWIKEKGENVFFFQKENKSIDGKFIRCNYIHPLCTLDGTVMTEDFPEDHLHHRGVFWAWHQIKINGKQVADGWELNDFNEKISSVEFKQIDSKGILKTTAEWRSPRWNEGNDPFVEEYALITIHPRTANYRRIDFEISLLALTDHVEIGGSDDEKGYGGFSVRMKLPEDVRFEGRDGLLEPQNTAIEGGNFVRIAGTIGKNGQQGGMVIFASPENPVQPQTWILRQKASMQNAVFPGRNTVSLSTTTPLVLKYSLLIYAGNMSSRQITKALK